MQLAIFLTPPPHSGLQLIAALIKPFLATDYRVRL
jgi:hypothetical protein